MIIITFLLASSFAQTLSIKAPCSDEILWSQSTSELPQNLGLATITSLERSGLQYLGTNQGINQINYSPIGMAAMEIHSANEMYSYGWCFSINGVIPEVYPHEITLNGNDQVVWFYGFAHFKAGEWVSQCEDSVLRRQEKFCQNP